MESTEMVAPCRPKTGEQEPEPGALGMGRASWGGDVMGNRLLPFLSADLLLVSDTVIRTQTGRETLRYPTGREDPLEQPELLVIWHLQYCLRDIFGIVAPCNLSLHCLLQCKCQAELILQLFSPPAVSRVWWQ